MDEGLKKRLIGATVLVSLVVIFVPMLLEEEPVVSTELEEKIIPEKPENNFSSKVLPLETEDLSKPLVEEPKPAKEEVTKSPVKEPVKKEVAKKEPEKKAESKPKPAPVEKKPAPMVGLSAWVVQVGSFSQRNNADKLVKELKAKKYAAFTDQVDVKGRILHRVLVGPEVDKKRAQQMLTNLNKYLKAKKLTGKLKSYN